MHAKIVPYPNSFPVPSENKENTALKENNVLLFTSSNLLDLLAGPGNVQLKFIPFLFLWIQKILAGICTSVSPHFNYRPSFKRWSEQKRSLSYLQKYIPIHNKKSTNIFFLKRMQETNFGETFSHFFQYVQLFTIHISDLATKWYLFKVI